MILRYIWECAVARNPDSIAIMDIRSGRDYTFQELDQLSATLAGGLETQAGIMPKERFLLSSPTCVEGIVTMIALWKLGLSLVPVHPGETEDRLTYFLEDSGATALIFHNSLNDKIASLRSKINIDKYICLGNAPEWAYAYDDLSYEDPGKLTYKEIADEDLAYLFYTSGTTGQPKGVPVEQIQCTFRMFPWLIRGSLVPGDRVAVFLPLFHVMGLNVLLSSIHTGSSLVLPEGNESPESMLRLIQDYSVSTMQLVPTLAYRMAVASNEDRFNLDSLRRVELSGAYTTDTVFKLVQDNLCPEVRIFYGSTEAMNLLYSRTAVNSLGYASDFQEIRIVEIGSRNPAKVMPTDEVGEIIARMDGPEVFDGYWNKPEKTGQVTEKGWFFTGDLAFRDEYGLHHFRGRADDMIVSGGENIYPAEIEGILLEHEAVAEVAVVGRSDEVWGERVVAFVKTNQATEPEILDQFCKDHPDLANFKRPREYHFVDDIPKNAAGKIDHGKLKRIFE